MADSYIRLTLSDPPPGDAHSGSLIRHLYAGESSNSSEKLSHAWSGSVDIKRLNTVLHCRCIQMGMLKMHPDVTTLCILREELWRLIKPIIRHVASWHSARDTLVLGEVFPRGMPMLCF